ncbi:MAG TPA: PAS domain S-box protein, partial [Anaerolineae bacterium]
MASRSKASSGLRNATYLGAGSAAALGALGLLGWISGLRALASIQPDYIPMAPDTAFLLIILGAVLVINAARSLAPRQRIALGAVVALASAYGLLKTIGYILGLDLTFENILFPVTETLGAFPLGRMSPVTGTFFLLSGTALLLILWNPSNSLLRNLAAGIGILIGMIGYIATSGYLFGAPLLYGGSVIPLAATTAIAFLMLGSGLVAGAGRDTVFVRPFVGASILARMLRAFIPLMVASMLIVDYAHDRLDTFPAEYHALLSAMLSLVFGLVAAAAVVYVGRSVSQAVERAQAERQRTVDELALERTLLRTVIDNMPAHVFVKDADSKIILSNASYARSHGSSPDALLGKTDFDLYPPDIAARHRAEDQAIVQSGDALADHEEPFVDASGKGQWLLTAKVPLRDSHGQIIGIVGTKQDISERKEAEAALRLAEEKYRAIVDYAVEGIFQSTPEGRFVTANISLARMLGYEDPEELRSTITNIGEQVYTDPLQRAIFQRLIEGQGEVRGFEFQVRRKDGSLMWVSENARAVRDAHGALLYYEGTMQNINMLRQTAAELQYVSAHDALTGVYNRAFFEAELARLNHGRHFPVSLVMADLNGLKQVNDTKGHAA